MTRPVLVVKRRHFDAFAAGEKTVEYRRYGPRFMERTYFPGRAVRIAYRYDLPNVLSAVVDSFARVPAGELGVDLSDVYPGLAPDTFMAVIKLREIRAGN